MNIQIKVNKKTFLAWLLFFGVFVFLVSRDLSNLDFLSFLYGIFFGLSASGSGLLFPFELVEK